MKTICGLCPRHCALKEGQTGFCGARKNDGGKIICKNYGWLTSIALDPIEKKPLSRFHPGSAILSVGSYGCNLRCPFCQNHAISMAGEEAEKIFISPELLVDKALELASNGTIGIAYTYNEPLVGYEYVRDCAKLIHEKGLRNVIVTNGNICAEPFAGLLPLIDAINIDLKGFSQEYYDFVGGDFETVRESIRLAAQSCHVEVTVLIVPGENDSDGEMRAMAGWLASVRKDIPLHVTRFFPKFQMQDLPPTPVKTVYRLAEVAREYLSFVYEGNC